MKIKNIILIIAIIVIASSIYYLESQKVAPQIPADLGEDGKEATVVDEPVETKEGKYPRAPELLGIVGYINTPEETKISDFKGKVVLIDFWTYTCINCIRTFPHLTEWHSKYKDKGLVIIGVHTPEFEFEKKKDNVIMAAKKYGLEYPIVQDNNYATWTVFKNRYWPRKYIIDADGYIRYDHIGEGAYKQTEEKIRELLAEIDQEVNDTALSTIEDKTPQKVLTPELYAGHNFALPRLQNLGNKGGFKTDRTSMYIIPEEIRNNVIHLEGEWKSTADNLETQGDASIVLSFRASSVNIVATPTNGEVRMEVFIDEDYVSKEQAGTDVVFEDGKAFVIVKEPRLYNVVNGESDRYLLKLSVDSPFSFNAFTFG